MGVGAGLYMYVVVVQKFTFAISSPDEFLLYTIILRYGANINTPKKLLREHDDNQLYMTVMPDALKSAPETLLLEI